MRHSTTYSIWMGGRGCIVMCYKRFFPRMSKAQKEIKRDTRKWRLWQLVRLLTHTLAFLHYLQRVKSGRENVTHLGGLDEKINSGPNRRESTGMCTKQSTATSLILLQTQMHNSIHANKGHQFPKKTHCLFFMVHTHVLQEFYYDSEGSTARNVAVSFVYLYEKLQWHQQMLIWGS